MKYNRTMKNAAWIIGCRIVQAVLGLIVTMISARYLGPSGYGLINYAAAIVAFFTPVMQLGLSSTLVQEIVNNPKDEGEILGTSITMTFVSSIACVIGIAIFATVFNRGETQTILVCVLYSILLIFQSVDMIKYWFQAKLMSKYTSITILVAYIFVSVYRIILLVSGSSIYWFAVSQAIDYAIIAIALVAIYARISDKKFKFSFERMKIMFSKSKYYIVSSMMVTVFAQTDRIMLKMLLDTSSVGFYSAAVTCAGMTSFVFSAIIDSARPTIFERKKTSQRLFEEAITLLYSIIIILSLLQSVFMTVFSKLIVGILYGSQYNATVDALRIVVWYTTFSYMGSVRNIWILSESKQKYLWIINLTGALTNVVLNIMFIPIWGINGAALASLITQFVTNFGTGYIIKPVRKNNQLLIKSISPKFLISCVRQIKTFKRR